ncbi:FHA domain-containing protein [Thermomonospora umbrina]|uniref:FHA domain-containing protein n=1 Tax=Thermomonospora umbrina TaxID=111806 RepID=A0A3D9SYW5_9ACTN|nr:FHA domain-containing protein [Thermomonospora umbrina]REE97764.1 FHA domain-containing protein [Thermomonospora umbrina]
MSMIGVVLDAANIANRNPPPNSPPGTPRRWEFARVERVRAACAARWPDRHVRAVIDASVMSRLADRAGAATAEREGWLITATGDADDDVLEIADRYAALVFSRDNFGHARLEYPWLDGEPDRVWWFSTRRGLVTLAPRPLKRLTPDEIERARREKERKAGRPVDDADRTWRCLAAEGVCTYAGGPVPAGMLREHRGAWFCMACNNEAEEVLYEPSPAAPPAAPTLLVQVDGDRRRTLDVPSGGLLLGRGGPRRPRVTDVTASLDRSAAKQISRDHLRVEVDDDGWPVAVHEGENGVTFLNPRIGPDGLPADNRLVRGEEYPLCDGDELVLGPGRVRIVVSCAEGDPE